MDLLASYKTTSKHRIISDTGLLTVHPSTDDAESHLHGFPHKLLLSHHFNQQIQLLMPSTLPSFHQLQSRLEETFVYYLDCDVAQLLTDQFFSQYILPCHHTSTPSTMPSSPSFLLTLLPSSNDVIPTTFCIINDILYMSMHKDIYQQLGLTGTVNEFRDLIRFSLRLTMNNIDRVRTALSALRIGTCNVALSFAHGTQSLPIIFPPSLHPKRCIPKIMVDDQLRPIKDGIPVTTMETSKLLDVNAFFAKVDEYNQQLSNDQDSDHRKHNHLTCSSMSENDFIIDEESTDEPDDESDDSDHSMGHDSIQGKDVQHSISPYKQAKQQYEQLIGQWNTYNALLMTQSLHNLTQPSSVDSLIGKLTPDLPFISNNKSNVVTMTISGILPSWVIYNIVKSVIIPSLSSTDLCWMAMHVIGLPTTVVYSNKFHFNSIGIGGNGESNYTLLLSSTSEDHAYRYLTLQSVDSNSNVT